MEGPTNRREACCFLTCERAHGVCWRAHEQKKSQWLLGFEQAFGGGGGRGYEKDFLSLANFVMGHRALVIKLQTNYQHVRDLMV